MLRKVTLCQWGTHSTAIARTITAAPRHLYRWLAMSNIKCKDLQIWKVCYYKKWKTKVQQTLYGRNIYGQRFILFTIAIDMPLLSEYGSEVQRHRMFIWITNWKKNCGFADSTCQSHYQLDTPITWSHKYSTGFRLNIKTVFPGYGDSHVKDKTVGETVLSLTWESLYW